MIKRIFHPVKTSGFEDPETATIFLNYDEAASVLSESVLLERVSSQDLEVEQRLRHLVVNQDLLKDFISLNKDTLIFEVYIAELLNGLDLSQAFLLKGYESGESVREVKE